MILTDAQIWSLIVGLITITVGMVKGFDSLVKPRFKQNEASLQRQQLIQLEKISDNHLDHILEAIEEQTRQNVQWHQKTFEILCEIKGILESRK
jgi:sulfite reductase beta subunit-like hemoprotein